MPVVGKCIHSNHYEDADERVSDRSIAIERNDCSDGTRRDVCKVNEALFMQPLFGIRDTSSFKGNALPAVLNEDAFWPFEPKTLEECGVSEMTLESLILQTFLAVGTATGRGMTEKVRLPYRIIEQQLAQLRVRQLIVHARPAPLNDFYYSLTDNGQKRAISYQKVSSYTGPAPVPLMDYVLSVEAQASNFEPITKPELKAALSAVTYDGSWLDFLGPAINSNSGIFLYGPPGNGKTTLARCLAACRGQEIWIPHAIIDDGMIIKLFDASYHLASNAPNSKSGIIADQEHDRRWIRIRRPTVVVGGELTLDSLEIRHDPRSNTCEAPLQMKSNCGCLLIDDFGRQRVAPAELLNRWIIPLESRHDFLNLPTGKKICVPFEQIILFSTNLQPEQLVDEAFLRRVPFKINIGDPPMDEFVELFKRECEANEVTWRPDVIEKLIVKHYRSVGRPLRRCHPRDLFHQVKCLCAYRGERLELRTEFLDLACRNYFGNQPIFQSSASSLAPPVGWDVPNAKGPQQAPAPSLTAVKPLLRPAPAPSVPISQSGQVVRTEILGEPPMLRPSVPNPLAPQRNASPLSVPMPTPNPSQSRANSGLPMPADIPPASPSAHERV
jgi:DNA polymerase III delta prime subunit